jgi:hypothetical protein
MSSHSKPSTPISKLVKGKSSLCGHDDDLGYFGGIGFSKSMVTNDVMLDFWGNQNLNVCGIVKNMIGFQIMLKCF